MYIDTVLINGTTAVPIDFLSLAKNRSISTVNTDLMKKHVFDMILHKLNHADDAPCTVVVQIRYTDPATESFGGIMRACHNSSFRGRMVCLVDPQTQITEGLFGKLRVTVRNTVFLANLVAPAHFPNLGGGALERVLIINRNT